jgi:hypothetical protein
MKNHPPQQAKILSHASGLGAPYTDLVRQRARELARIDGRPEPNERDWRQAKIELHGGHPTNGDGDDEMSVAVSERDMVAGGMGRQAPRYGGEGNGSLGEELVAEGLDEAVHEQMLEARLLDAEEDPDE